MLGVGETALGAGSGSMAGPVGWSRTSGRVLSGAPAGPGVAVGAWVGARFGDAGVRFGDAGVRLSVASGVDGSGEGDATGARLADADSGTAVVGEALGVLFAVSEAPCGVAGPAGVMIGALSKVTVSWAEAVV